MKIDGKGLFRRIGATQDWGICDFERLSKVCALGMACSRERQPVLPGQALTINHVRECQGTHKEGNK